MLCRVGWVVYPHTYNSTVKLHYLVARPQFIWQIVYNILVAYYQFWWLMTTILVCWLNGFLITLFGVLDRLRWYATNGWVGTLLLHHFFIPMLIRWLIISMLITNVVLMTLIDDLLRTVIDIVWMAYHFSVSVFMIELLPLDSHWAS